jgi:hypothetical protein
MPYPNETGGKSFQAFVVEYWQEVADGNEKLVE